MMMIMTITVVTALKVNKEDFHKLDFKITIVNCFLLLCRLCSSEQWINILSTVLSACSEMPQLGTNLIDMMCVSKHRTSVKMETHTH